ncbi:MAG: DUF4124 domain-containing protein [Gammaproteobacteria bacterium]|nr:MAG: DUF4124 domain-containing protein [Gammaproteobacteria bacterium]
MRYLFSFMVLVVAIITILAAMVNFPAPVSGIQSFQNGVNTISEKLTKDVRQTGSELENSVRKWIDEAGTVNYTDSKYVPTGAESESVDTTVAAEIPAENLNNKTGVNGR